MSFCFVFPIPRFVELEFLSDCAILKSIRILFHRFCSFNNVNIMIDFIGSGWNVRK